MTVNPLEDQAIKISGDDYRLLVEEKAKTNIPIKYLVRRALRDGVKIGERKGSKK